MDRNEKIKRLFSFMIPLLALLLLLWIGQNYVEQSADVISVSEMSVSLESGFYAENQTLTVTAPKGTEIFYTQNGAEPNRENGILYSEPIKLLVSEDEVVRYFRFRAYYEDGSESEVITRTFFMGENIANRYTTNVLHITGDPEGLYGYEEGIFVPGKLYDEYMEANPDAVYGPGIEANFFLKGDEYEREVYIEYFSEDGEKLFALNGGLRIHGALTRLKTQKSFRLYARREYDEQNEFDYPIFGGLLSEVDGTVAEEHKRLVVRNSGNDNGYAFIRNELITALADEAGFPDVTHSEPVCVYINGVYQGFYWLENTFDTQYFENRYGEHTGEFVVLEGSDVTKIDDEDSVVQSYVEEYNALYQKFSNMDLTDEQNYAALCDVLDVENYLQYFAIQNYVCNLDWPDNNVKVYRYVAREDAYGDLVFDGRYRHLLYDVDYGFGIIEFIGYNAMTRTLPLAMEGSPLFAALMKRQDCRDYYINYTCDLMNGAFSLERVSEKLSEMCAEREAELFYMLEETTIMEGSWGWEEDISTHYDNVEKSYATIRNFAEERPLQVLNDIIECLKMEAEDAYTLTLRKEGLSSVQLNSIKVDEAEFSGAYFGRVPVSLTPQLAQNEEFAYWIVNGEIREGEQLQLTSEDIVEYCIDVELVTKAVENPVLQINAVRARGNSDYIELINNSEVDVSTGGYYLTDGEDLFQYALPDIILQPGETRRFYGEECEDLEGLGEFGLNFDIKQGETITLSYKEQMLEALVIPQLSLGGVYQRIGTGDEFEEIIP